MSVGDRLLPIAWCVLARQWHREAGSATCSRHCDTASGQLARWWSVWLAGLLAFIARPDSGEPARTLCGPAVGSGLDQREYRALQDGGEQDLTPAAPGIGGFRRIIVRPDQRPDPPENGRRSCCRACRPACRSACTTTWPSSSPATRSPGQPRPARRQRRVPPLRPARRAGLSAGSFRSPPRSRVALARCSTRLPGWRPAGHRRARLTRASRPDQPWAWPAGTAGP